MLRLDLLGLPDVVDDDLDTVDLEGEDDLGKGRIYAQAAEFLNKIASTKNLYQYEVMKLAATYSRTAIATFDSAEIDSEEVRWALYWGCLNLATVVGMAPTDEESSVAAPKLTVDITFVLEAES